MLSRIVWTGVARCAALVGTIDGLKPEYVRLADSLGLRVGTLRVATLRALAKNGASRTPGVDDWRSHGVRSRAEPGPWTRAFTEVIVKRL